MLDVLPNNPTQVIAHYAQNAAMERFQKYIDSDTYFGGDNKSDLYDITIKKDTGMKIALMAGLWDDTVPLDKTVEVATQLTGIGALIEFAAAPW